MNKKESLALMGVGFLVSWMMVKPFQYLTLALVFSLGVAVGHYLQLIISLAGRM